MRLLVLALAAVFPTLASAQSLTAMMNSCPSFSELADMQKTVGSGPGAIENAVRFYSSLYGRPQSEKQAPKEVTLTWALPKASKRSKTATRMITVSFGDAPFPNVSCHIEFK